MAGPTRRAVLTGTAALAASPALAATMPARRSVTAAAAKAARRMFDSGPAPALSIAVADRGGVLWTTALGLANIELGVAAAPTHSFRLGSISKVLTSTTAASLAVRGRLDLDAPLSTYLDDLPRQHRETTLRLLLTHRGGIRHYGRKDFDLSAPGGPIYMRTYPSAKDVLAVFIDDPLVAPPGSKVSYSSFGYSLVSLTIESAVGMPFRDVVRREIGDRLALPSLAVDDPLAVIRNRATGYMNAQDIAMLYGALPAESRPALTGGWANIPFSNPVYSLGGAGFLMTPTDTARFGAAMLPGAGGKIDAAERELLFTP